MSDEPFQRPGSSPEGQHAVPSPVRPEVWQPEHALAPEAVVFTAEVQPVTSEPRGRSPKLGSGLVLGLGGLLVGLAIGAVFIDTPPPAPVAITLETFPTELFGEPRDDIEWRTAAFKPRVDRLDQQFEDQLSRYRFAYGGDGADFTYAGHTLAIVNGRLATEIPVSEGSEWNQSTVVSLDSGETSCVSEDEDALIEIVDEMILPADPNKEFGPDAVVAGYAHRADEESPAMWTECVLFDDQRNLSLRLTGFAPGDDILAAAASYRDELVAIHADLTG